VDVILKEVWQIAEKDRLVSKSVRSLKIAGEGRFRELPMQIELEGNFRNFYTFLLAVERLPRITQINELMLDKEQKKEGAARADMKLSIFYEQEDDLGDLQ
jgi:Tfp pilus assembly protein PilO